MFIHRWRMPRAALTALCSPSDKPGLVSMARCIAVILVIVLVGVGVVCCYIIYIWGRDDMGCMYDLTF
jgi:hypothetical protein